MNTKSNSFLKNFNNKYGYLVHSYECIPENKNNIIGTYKILDKKVVCAVQNNNVIGLQFHPEKSDYQGIKIFKKFFRYGNEIISNSFGKKKFKRLKNKHHLLIGNKSMIEYTFDFLNNLNFFENIIVSTDDKKILSKVKNIQILYLSKICKLSKDSSDSYEVLISVYNLYKKYSSVDGIFLFQPTIPLEKLVL